MIESTIDLKPVLNRVLESYELSLGGVHGLAHWARVLENGRRLADETGAHQAVVGLFAILHDARRFNESTGPDHGPRAAEFAIEIRDELIDLPDEQFRLLCRACDGHTHELSHPDMTIQTCWDADRLDLGRVGVTPHPSRLCTDAAKRQETINWADGRAQFGVIPDFVLDQWGIELSPPNPW